MAQIHPDPHVPSSKPMLAVTIVPTCDSWFRAAAPTRIVMGETSGICCRHRMNGAAVAKIAAGRQALLPAANFVSALLPQTRAAKVRRAAYVASGVSIDPDANVNGYARIFGPNVSIGSSWVGLGAMIISTNGAGVVIGDRCDIGPQVFITTGSHAIGAAGRRAGRGSEASVVIGDGCWIGARVCVLPGVTIGSGCVIAAGAVVINDVPANSMVAGVPAKIVRHLGDD